MRTIKERHNAWVDTIQGIADVLDDLRKVFKTKEQVQLPLSQRCKISQLYSNLIQTE